MKKKNNIGGFTLPDFKIYCKDTVIITALYCQKAKYIDQ